MKNKETNLTKIIDRFAYYTQKELRPTKYYTVLFFLLLNDSGHLCDVITKTLYIFNNLISATMATEFG